MPAVPPVMRMLLVVFDIVIVLWCSVVPSMVVLRKCAVIERLLLVQNQELTFDLQVMLL